MKKYILQKRVKFQKALSPEASKYFDSLQRVNKWKVKKAILKRYKADNLRQALWKSRHNAYWRKYWAKRSYEERVSRQGLFILITFYVAFLVMMWVVSKF